MRRILRGEPLRSGIKRGEGPELAGIERRSRLTSVRISAFSLATYAHSERLAYRFDVLKDGRAP